MDDIGMIYVATLHLAVSMESGVEERFVMVSENPAHGKCYAPCVLKDIAVVALALEKLWKSTTPTTDEAA